MDVYHCCETLFLEKCELMPGREQYTDQSADTTKLQLGNPSNFIWVTYRNMDEGLHIGAHITCQKPTPA